MPRDSQRDGAGGRLFIVSTPIGNMGDMTVRAVAVLREASLVLAEDTRHSRRLLDHFEIATRVESYHEHNEARATPRVVERLRAGATVALISDAGTPMISDPGARLVRAAIEAGIAVSAIPGASALLAALVVSGLDADHFTFFGFLPRRGGERAEVLDQLLSLPHTALFYEAPGRVADTLEELVVRGWGERTTVVARELTKHHEDVRRGTAAELAKYYQDSPPRGEVVIVVAGAVPVVLDEEMLRDRALALRAGGATSRDVARMLVEEHGAPRNLAYRLAHE